MTGNLEYRRGGGKVNISLPRSAPIQIKPFPKIKELCRYWKSEGYTGVVDIGCGYLRNSLVFVKHFKLWVSDFDRILSSEAAKTRLARLGRHQNFKGIIQPGKLSRGSVKVDAAVIAFVLHTLPDESLRVKIVKCARKNTKPPHPVFIAVPNCEVYYRKRMSASNRFRDGYLFDAGSGYKTFYREYSASEIDDFMENLGYVVDKAFTADKKNMRVYVYGS